MKGLTIEQKAKRYDEALERMKSWVKGEHPECFSEAQKAAEFIFLELKESKDERIRKALIRFHKSTIDVDGIKGEDIIAWLEKQGEQKPADDEPKFHEGEWIIGDKDNTVHQVKSAIKNVSNGKYAYDLIDGGYISTSHESDYHLWTIQDAKDGDVVTCPANDSYSQKIIFIFKRLIDGDVECYCCINAYGNFDSCINTSDIIGEIEDNDYTPATKEQRDIFFAMMKDAGYEWDADRKELKKIDEEINGEDYGIDGLWHAQRILEKTLGEVDGYQSDDGILEHKAAITAVKKLYKQKYAKYN